MGSKLKPVERRNFWLCVGNGAIISMANAFYSFDTVLAGLAFSLTGSPFLVGLLSSTAAVGWQWPQIFVGSRIEHIERKLPIYVTTTLLRLLALLAMTLSVWGLSHRPMLLFALIWLATAVLSSGGGICVIPFMDIVAKSIPAQHRSMLFAYRRFFGGLLGFFAGGVSVYILSPQSGLRYPNNYAVLLLGGTALSALAFACFMGTKEPLEKVAEEALPFRAFLKRGLGLFRKDRNFRLYYLYRVAFAAATMSQILFVPFVMQRFAAPAATTGWFAAAIALSIGLSSMLWGRLSHRFGEVSAFRLAALFLFSAPLLALAMALCTQFPLANAWLGKHYLGLSLALFVIQTIGRNGSDIAGMVHLLGLAPADLRPTYMSFMNTLSAPLMAAPLLAGFLATLGSYELVFALSALSALLALAIALKLKNQSG